MKWTHAFPSDAKVSCFTNNNLLVTFFQVVYLQVGGIYIFKSKLFFSLLPLVAFIFASTHETVVAFMATCISHMFSHSPLHLWCYVLKIT